MQKRRRWEKVEQEGQSMEKKTADSDANPLGLIKEVVKIRELLALASETQ